MRFTRKQEEFVDWYCSAVVNMNGTEAARRAGYKGNENTLSTVAAENLRKPKIRKEIDRRMASMTSKVQVTIEKVLVDLEITRVRALTDGNYSAAVKCSELQGKYLKMFSDRIEHVQTLEEVSTDELLRLIQNILESGDTSVLELLTAATKKINLQ